MRLRIGLGIWILAAGVAFEGQVLATSPHPEDGRPWLIAAALLGCWRLPSWLCRVLVTSPSNLAHELDAYQVTTIPQVLAIQAQHTLEAFHMRGETSLEYGHPAPLF